MWKIEDMEKEIRDNLGWHYTCMDSFLKILNGIEGDNFIFQASSLFSMNDTSEFMYGSKKVMEILPQIENELDVEGDFKLSCLYGDCNDYPGSYLLENQINLMNTSFQHPFVVSYSKAMDSLPQWGMYGDNGYGISLGFDVRYYYIKKKDNEGGLIYDFTRIDFDIPHSVDVLYTDTITPKDIVYYYIKYFYNLYLNRIKEKKEILPKEKIQIEELGKILFFSASFIKHHSYEYERESRIISMWKNYSDIHFKARDKGTLVPYIEIGIPVSSLREIMVGPCCKYSSIKPCIELLLHQKGFGEEVVITQSKVPFRS